MKQIVLGRALALRLVSIVALVLLALAQIAGAPSPVAAQDTATIEITNIDTGTGLPAPFTRFQVTSENGTVYGPLETDLNGYVAFSVIVDPWGTSFTVEEETPPACAPPPAPQTTDPLAPGESVALEFSTQDRPGCGLGTIALYAMTCPEGFSGPADDYAPWRDSCTATADGVPFTITSAGTGESWHPSSGAYGIPGRAPLVGLPAGDYTFRQDDGAPSAVFCLVFDTANYATSAEPSAILPVALTNGTGTLTMSGNRVTCDLFSVPGGGEIEPPMSEVQPAAGASLDIHLSACPPGYTSDGSIYDDCHGNGIAGQPVRLSSDTGFAGAIATIVPNSPGPGIASFTGLPDGVYTIATQVPADTAVFTYCTDASDLEVPAVYDAVNRALTLDLASGDAVTCDWYLLPAAEVQPATGNAFIEVHALRCPNGTNPESDLYAACHANGMAGIAFSASGPNGFFGQQLTTVPVSPGPGIATFTGMTGGAYTVTQENLDPSWTLVMYCSLADADDMVPYTRIDNATISFELPDDTGVVCDFSSIPPADQATTLQVINYSCPMGTLIDASTPLATLESICAGTLDGIDVTLTPVGQQGSTLESGSAGPGTVLFEGLPSGNFYLGNSIPGDFDTPWAFCGVEGTALQPLASLQGGPPLAIDASAGPYLCKWFNNPYNASGFSDTVAVTSYLCPPGITSGYADRCGATPLANTTFQLVRDGTSDRYSGLTDGQGALAFERLLPGSYTVTALPPAGVNIAVYVVSCSADGADVDFDYNDATGMRIELDLPGGIDVDCAWYNIPPGQPTVQPGQSSGSITVRKFLCQGKSVNAYNWDADCVPQTIAAGFSLKTADGRPIAVGSTDSTGVLKYTQLANGAYDLDETTGKWCHAEADRVDAAGNVLVANGGNTDVYIYNCSVGQVETLPSTGAGASRAPVDTAFERGDFWLLALAAGATLGLAVIARRRLQQVATGAARGDDPAAPGEASNDGA